MHLADRAEIETLEQLKGELLGAAHGTQGAVATRGAQQLGCSVPTLYKKLRGIGYDSGRKVRADRGKTKVTLEAARAIAGMTFVSQRDNDKQMLPIRDSIDIAQANGLLQVQVSETTVMRALRTFKCHPKDLRRASPHRSMRSLHPNHVWQLDASICVLYRIAGKQGLRAMRQAEFNERKPNALIKIVNERVLRYAVTDHYSGSAVARYYETSGENTETLFDFLMYATERRALSNGGDGCDMHGWPVMMVWDQSAASQSHAIQNLLNGLGVDHWTHEAENSRAKGQVEKTHDIIERSFEGRLRLTKVESIEQLNAHLDVFMQDFNHGRLHSRHGHTRRAMWGFITAEQLRLSPGREVCQQLMYSKPQTRVVDGELKVSFKVKGYEQCFYSLEHVEGVRNGDQVLVSVNPYRAPSIWVHREDANGKKFFVECEPIAYDRAGLRVDAKAFGEGYDALKDTADETARKDINEAAWGKRDERQARSVRDKGAVAFGGKIDAFADLHQRKDQLPTYLPRRGTEMNVPGSVQIEVRPLDHVTAMKEIRARLTRPLTPEDNAHVRAWFPDGVPEADLDALVLRLTAPAVELPPVRAALQLVR
jgi:transposase InsO family protein